MNQLRQLMLEELQRRNFAATTIRTYLHGVAHCSRYCRRPPDQLGPEDIRECQAMLFTKLKYSPNTVTLGYTHLVTADDVRVARELGAVLDKGFLAQDLPKFAPNAEKASALLTEAV